MTWKTMTNLEEIITILKAKYVVIIENDLHYEEDNNKILAKYVSLSDFGRARLIESFTKLDLIASLDNLEKFRIGFEALEHTEFRDALLPDDLQEYLKNVNGTALIDDELNISIEKLKDSELGKEALLRSGIHRFIDDRYDTIITTLSSIKDLELAYYRSTPVPASIDTFINELIEGIHKTESLYYLAIVDKMLGEGTDESGKRFIVEDLIPHNKKKDLKGLAFLFTSMPNDSHPKDFESYFIREVEKGHADVPEVIARYLTDIAYASVFKSFADDFGRSSQDALKIALRNQNNVRHIITKSVNEGISAFDTLRFWFKLIMQKKFDESQVNELNYYGALTRFFDIKKLQNHNYFSEFGEEMEELNSFELFDFNINKKGLPISPGDIFKKNEDFYILIGQSCDLLVRDNGTRGGKIAEFLKINIVAYPTSDSKAEKFAINTDSNGTTSVDIFHFFDGDKYVVAKINITSKNTYFGDFKCLDLCFFNEDGQSKINTKSIDEYSKLHWINEPKTNYIRGLHEYFSKNILALSAAKEVCDSKVNIFSSTHFEEEIEHLNFGFSRFARLKGRFYDSLFQQVINYKGRIDLNLIEQAIETSKEIDLKVKFEYLEIEEIIRTRLVRIKSEKEYIDSEQLAKAVSDLFLKVVNKYSRFELGKGKNKENYTLSKDENDNQKYVLLLPITYTNKDNKLAFVSDTFVKYTRLFKESLNNKNFIYLNTDEEGSLNEDQQINISDIKRGIRFIENNILLKLEHGSIISSKE